MDMKLNKETVLLGIIILLSFWHILKMDSIKTDLKNYNTKIKEIQKEIDSVQIENKKLIVAINSIDKEIDNIDGNIINVTKNINVIKNQTNAKIDSINNFNFSDLEKFFSDRYRDQH
jgi:septal ring factor EnvC (AmiA/AmiB activator)